MAEEQRCQEGHRLCANNCGFFGSPATMDLCSKCYRHYHLKEERASSAKIAVEKSLQPPSSSSSPSASSSAAASTVAPSVGVSEPSADVRPPLCLTSPVTADKSSPSPAPGSNRCTACRKRVGLTGFKCRCGATFCGAHRYPEQHACTFDYKAAGREAIARANPLVKADKLDKI